MLEVMKLIRQQMAGPTRVLYKSSAAANEKAWPPTNWQSALSNESGKSAGDANFAKSSDIIVRN